MKLLKLGVVLLLVVVGAIVAFTSFGLINNNDTSNDKIVFDDLNMFKEEECKEVLYRFI